MASGWIVRSPLDHDMTSPTSRNAKLRFWKADCILGGMMIFPDVSIGRVKLGPPDDGVIIAWIFPLVKSIALMV